MSNLLFHIFALFCRLLRDVIHFVRFGRTVRTFSWPMRRSETRPAPPLLPAPQPSIENTLQRDPMAELALLKAENRATMREANALRRKMNERRRLEREAARARGELPPAKPRKPREPKPQAPPQALPEVPPAVTVALNSSPLPQIQFKALPAAPPTIPSLSIPSRPMPSQATTSQTTLPRPKPPRTLFKTLSTIVIAPLRILKAALLALPRFFCRRRPPSDSPPAARPTAPSLQNRAA